MISARFLNEREKLRRRRRRSLDEHSRGPAESDEEEEEEELSSVADNDYQWKKINVDEHVDDGFVGMDELDGEEARALTVKLLKKRALEKGNDIEEDEEDDDEEDDDDEEEEEEEESSEEEHMAPEEPDEVFVAPPEMGSWFRFGLHPSLMKGLFELGFLQPTKVQEAALTSSMIKGNDVVGAAQTGSGKTLAFGLPLLQAVLDAQSNPRKRKAPVGLILCPTRELAMQVTQHLKDVAKFCVEGNGEARQTLMVVPVVGGMSEQKQMRLLNRRPAIVVATPGRIWEFIRRRNGTSVAEQFLHRIDRIRYLVIDEADRLTATGRYAEVQHMLEMLPLYRSNKAAAQAASEKAAAAELDEADPEFWKEHIKLPEEEYLEEDRRDLKFSDKKRTTFLFSATLGISQSAKRDLRKWKNQLKRKAQLDGLERVLAMLDFHHSVEVIDLSTGLKLANKQGEVVDAQDMTVADGVHQTYVLMTQEEKDAYLYAFLRKYNRGRSMVFCNAITGVKRLAALFRICGLDAHPLHASMQQRQRLKNLDRFKVREDAILIATDVAARGLDIPNVQHVIHFDVPRTGETYVHRAGRTARAGKEGLSLVFVSPNDSIAFDRMKAQAEAGMKRFPIEVGYLPLTKDILRKAKEIDEVVHTNRKAAFDKNWKEKNAAALDVDDEGNKSGGADGKLTKEQKSRLKFLETQLRELIAEPFLPRGMSGKYPSKDPNTLAFVQSSANALKDLYARQKKSKEEQQPKKKKRKKKAFFYKPK